MYNVKNQQIVLEIPKNGSRTLVAAASLAWGKHYLRVQGHKTLRRMLDGELQRGVSNKRKLPSSSVQVVAVIRNPVERLRSQVNHHCRHKQGATLDDAMTACWEQSHVLWTPQAEFVEVPKVGEWYVDLRLFPMDRIDDACIFISGGKEILAHKNTAPHFQHDLDAIMRHRLFDAIMDERYHADRKLWIDAQRRNKDGL